MDDQKKSSTDYSQLIEEHFEEDELKTEETIEDETPEVDEPFVIKVFSRRDERQLALFLLYALDRHDYAVPLDEVTAAFEEDFDIKISHQSFPFLVVQGVLEKQEDFSRIITPFLKNWQLERLGCCTRLILNIALWELFQPNPICSIIINEAIELAKIFAEKDAYKFVNGVLDEIIKKGEIDGHPLPPMQQQEVKDDEPKGDT